MSRLEKRKSLLLRQTASIDSRVRNRGPAPPVTAGLNQPLLRQDLKQAQIQDDPANESNSRKRLSPGNNRKSDRRQVVSDGLRRRREEDRKGGLRHKAEENHHQG